MNTDRITLQADLFSLISRLYHFVIDKEVLLFGIRGAILSPLNAKPYQSTIDSWHQHIDLIPTAPDYHRCLCVIGVLNLKTNKICAYQGSTVPNATWILAQQHTKRPTANLLGVGLYSYYIGTHEPDHFPPQEGAWRLNESIPVGVWRRYSQNQSFENLSATFESGMPNDNLHSADLQISADPNIQFSSAGCQTIPDAEFQIFRMMAGQSIHPDPKQIGTLYDYLLMSSQDLIKIQTQDNLEPKIMQGATGELVTQIQNQLITRGFLQQQQITQIGYYDGNTALAVYHFQQAKKHTADGIMKHMDFKELGL